MCAVGAQSVTFKSTSCFRSEGEREKATSCEPPGDLNVQRRSARKVGASGWRQPSDAKIANRLQWPRGRAGKTWQPALVQWWQKFKWTATSFPLLIPCFHTILFLSSLVGCPLGRLVLVGRLVNVTGLQVPISATKSELDACE